jgi:hypothetical protein
MTAPENTFEGRYTLSTRLWIDSEIEARCALDMQSGEPVTAILFHPSTRPSPGGLAAFQEVARRLSMLSHPGLNEVLSSGVEHGTPYLITRDVEGSPLSRLLDGAASDVSLDSLLRALTRFAEAVEHAHKASFFHGAIVTDRLCFSELHSTVVGIGLLQLVRSLKTGAFQVEHGDEAHHEADLAALHAISAQILAKKSPPARTASAPPLAPVQEEAPVVNALRALTPPEARPRTIPPMPPPDPSPQVQAAASQPKQTSWSWPPPRPASMPPANRPSSVPIGAALAQKRSTPPPAPRASVPPPPAPAPQRVSAPPPLAPRASVAPRTSMPAIAKSSLPPAAKISSPPVSAKISSPPPAAKKSIAPHRAFDDDVEISSYNSQTLKPRYMQWLGGAGKGSFDPHAPWAGSAHLIAICAVTLVMAVLMLTA